MHSHSSCSRRLPASARHPLRMTPRGRHRLRIRAAATVLPKQFKNVTPVGERVFVRNEETDVRTTGGLVLPESAQQRPTFGEISAISEGCALKVGDTIAYGEFSGTDITLGGKKHVILKEADVLGTYDGRSIQGMKPIGDRILVKVFETEEETSAGLLLTAAESEKPTFGTVLSIGPGKRAEDDTTPTTPPNVTVGSTILYSKYSGTEFKGENDEWYIVIKEGDVLAELG